MEAESMPLVEDPTSASCSELETSIPTEPKPQSRLRFGISTLLVGALCIAAGLSYKGFGVSKDVAARVKIGSNAKLMTLQGDNPSFTMTVSGMTYMSDMLFDCPETDQSNVTVKWSGEPKPGNLEVGKSEGNPKPLSYYVNPTYKSSALDKFLLHWIASPDCWIPDSFPVDIMFWKPFGGGEYCGEWIFGPKGQCCGKGWDYTGGTTALYYFENVLNPKSDDPRDWEWFKTVYFVPDVHREDESTYPPPPPARFYPKSYKNGLEKLEWCPTSGDQSKRMDSYFKQGYC